MIELHDRSVDLPGRVEPSRIDQARSVCEFILSRMDNRNRYVPAEALYAESIGYRSSLAAYLAEAGRVLGETRYIEASGRMLHSLLDERVDDMWPVGFWAEFPIFRGVPVGWEAMYNHKPDLRYTALTVAALGVFHRASGDSTVVEPARRALAKILQNWNFEREKKKALHLSFEVLALAIAAWEQEFPEFAAHKAPILQWVLDTFVEMAPKDFPFLTMYRTLLVLNETGARHIDSLVRPGLDALLSEPQWRCPENGNDFFHIPDTADHVNVRGNAAVAITLRLIDRAAGKIIYTDSPTYRHVTAWIEGQRMPDGAYFGCREHNQGRRYCLGSPAQYLPLCWLIGGF